MVNWLPLGGGGMFVRFPPVIGGRLRYEFETLVGSDIFNGLCTSEAIHRFIADALLQ